MYFSIASLALRGFPFLAGFYSKDAIIEIFFAREQNFFIILVLLISTCLTLIYRIRLIYLTFLKKLNLTPPFLVSKEDFIIVSPILLLFVFSVRAGRIFS